jgi:hypothetical protein
MSEIIVAIPVNHDLILYPCLQATECNRRVSALDGIPVDSQVDSESTERAPVVKIFARHRYAVDGVGG